MHKGSERLNLLPSFIQGIEVSNDRQFKPTWHDVTIDELVDLMTPSPDESKPYLSPFSVMQGFWDLFGKRADDHQNLARLLQLSKSIGAKEMERMHGITLVD